MIKWIKSWLTMKRRQKLFTDIVDGRAVFLYEDCYGTQWMANYSRWGFRVKMTTPA